MSDDRPLLEPPTTRLGGGGSAHAVAIGVVVVLVVLVWVGWSGRPAGPSGGAAVLPSGAPAPPAIGSGSAEPGSAGSPALPPTAPAEATPQPHPPGLAPAATIRPSVRLADDVYAITAGYPGAGSGGMLRVVDRGHLQARLLMELASNAPASDMTLELHQLSSVGMPNSYLKLDSWEMASGDFMPATPLGLRMLEARVEARPDAQNTSLLVRRGFTIQVHAAERGSVVELVVDINLLTPTRRPADEDHRIFP